HWRDDDRLYWHGSSASRMIRSVEGGAPVCLTVSFLDGLVLARSGFHCSVNYRSAMAFGHARAVTDEAHRLAALKDFIDKMMPGRWDDMRPPNEQEMKATTVVYMDIEEASAKIRTGPPIDDEEDYALSCWAGVLPIEQHIGQPIADPKLAAGTPEPDYLRAFKLLDGGGD
ncbi:MAG: pyridoxamine 5'-phosphate oxidase family protein, partial [Alphaproteobacteria bacterium]|nr:pyridoxamine 5'-phosphate oxidase family protein [Alphaproteobacteria bacterium]